MVKEEIGSAELAQFHGYENDVQDIYFRKVFIARL